MTCMLCVTQVSQHIACPTCRTRTRVSEIAFVHAGRAPAKEEGGSALDDEDSIPVRGSYSTKVRPAVSLQGSLHTPFLLFFLFFEV